MSEKDVTLGGGAFIALLRDLEEELDPASCAYPDFNYWPILRFAINYKRKMGESLRKGNAPVVSQRRRNWLNFSAKFRRRPEKPHIPSRLRLGKEPAAPVEVLYLNRKHQYTSGPDGALIQPFTDALRYIVRDTAPASMTLVDRRPKGSCLIPPERIPKIGSFRTTSLIKPRTASDLRLRDAILERVHHLNQLLAKYAPDLQLSTEDILVNIEMTSAKLHAMRALLEDISPKVVYLSSYTGAHYICAAARPLGITVVDIQHGSMHRHHALAANWHRVPTGGYELLPDFFWCWNARSANYVSQTVPPCHGTIVGGNPKAALEQLLMPADPSCAIRHDRSQVILALQYGAEALVMPHVLEAYRRTRHSVDWHFRMHPMGWDRLSEAIETLGVPQEAIVAASRLPLHQQLPQMDLLVTNASTIVFEALEHGVRPVVCSSQGALTFDDLRQSGELAYAKDTETLCAEIEALESNPVKPAGTGGAGGTDPDHIRRTFAEILGRAGC